MLSVLQAHSVVLLVPRELSASSALLDHKDCKVRLVLLEHTAVLPVLRARWVLLA